MSAVLKYISPLSSALAIRQHVLNAEQRMVTPLEELEAEGAEPTQGVG